MVFAPGTLDRDERAAVTKQVNEHFKGTGVRARAYTGNRASKKLLSTGDRIVFIGNSKSDYKGFLQSAGVDEPRAGSYDYVVSDSSNSDAGADVGGAANVGGTTTAVVNTEGFDQDTAAEAVSHEGGHLYGLKHQGQDDKGKPRKRKRYELMYEVTRKRSPIRKKFTKPGKQSIRERIEKDKRELQAQ